MPEGLSLPKRFQDDWLAHPIYGAWFRKFLDKMHEEQPGISLTLDGDDTPRTPQKGRSDEMNDSSPPSKRARVECTVSPEHLVPKTSEVPMLVVPLVGLAGGVLNVYTQNKMRLVN